jgi:hypothetical protein
LSEAEYRPAGQSIDVALPTGHCQASRRAQVRPIEFQSSQKSKYGCHGLGLGWLSHKLHAYMVEAELFRPDKFYLRDCRVAYTNLV